MSRTMPDEAYRRLVRDGLNPENNTITMLQIGTDAYIGSISHSVHVKTIAFPFRHVRPFSDVYLGLHAWRMHKLHQFDTVVVADASLVWWVLFVSQKPTVVYFINTLHRTLSRMTHRWMRYLYTIIVERSVRSVVNYCFVLSDDGYVYAQKYFLMEPSHIRMITPNTLHDTVSFSIANEKKRDMFGIPPDACVVLSVSRLEKEKGVDRLLEYMQYSPSTVYCLIIGEGSQKGYLLARAKELCLSDRVIFIGAVPHDEVFQYYSLANVLVQLSRSESLGLSVLEAMYAGLPVMVSPVGGLRDSIGDANERGFAVTSVDDWNNALQCISEKNKLLEDMKKNAKTYIMDKLQKSKTINELL
jgi:glycosyltransferase involved in cell wall biosynthesis